ncbi:TnsA endonuclease-like protein [Iodobacter fluviatilis]|uniref:TnsA endonuclease-like protein n=1 Tax=Iodobacter fluviatilis TaxID=537 RepID=A0A377QAP5_9NEIS|nr:TnsA endonuclease-like protein [Iodobacter fluviatilis]STQ91952.1 Transposon Tn7 transposition protein tnsA [Iodobacter fluviatilis]
MRGRRFKTQADIDRYISQGYGQGEGPQYLPWLRVQDVPSKGRSRKVQGTKVDRLHHLLSDVEFACFLTLEFSEQVIDIREQFPLFPTEQAIDIANQLGIRYPLYRGTQLHFVMTTDFLITLQATDGTRYLAARSVKTEGDLLPSSELKRTIEKLELEKALLQVQGVHDWKLVTEKTMGATLIENLIWLRKGKTLERHLLKPDTHSQFIHALEFYANKERTLASVIRASATSTHIPYTDGILLFKYLVLNKNICFDITKQELKLTGFCPLLTASNMPVSKVLKAA